MNMVKPWICRIEAIRIPASGVAVGRLRFVVVESSEQPTAVLLPCDPGLLPDTSP